MLRLRSRAQIKAILSCSHPIRQGVSWASSWPSDTSLSRALINFKSLTKIKLTQDKFETRPSVHVSTSVRSLRIARTKTAFALLLVALSPSLVVSLQWFVISCNHRIASSKSQHHIFFLPQATAPERPTLLERDRHGSSFCLCVRI